MAGGGGKATVDPNATPVWSLLCLLTVVGFALIGAFLFALTGGVKLRRTKCCKKGCSTKPVCGKVQLPPLVGMIIMGLIARNLPALASNNFSKLTWMDSYNDIWAHYIRIVCLGVILLRGGMEIEFKGTGVVVILLTLVPQAVEAAAVGLPAIGLFPGMSLALAFALGNVIAAASPAILVPPLLKLVSKGYGVREGIPTALIAASSFDDIVAITFFGICATVSFNQVSEGGISPGMAVLTNLYQIITGVVMGLALGFSMLLTRKCQRSQTCLTFAALLCTAIILGISQATKFYEAKFVGVVIYGYLAQRIWKRDKPEHNLEHVWNYLTPFLFGTIGAAVRLSEVQTGVLGKALALLAIGLIFRWLSTFLVAFKFNLKERLFVAFAWIPKATVQAAIGGFVLAQAEAELASLDPSIQDERRSNLELMKDHGLAILTVAVVSIILTAPVGAAIIQPLGEKWLRRTDGQPRAGDEDFIKRDDDFLGMAPPQNDQELDEEGLEIDDAYRRNQSMAMLQGPDTRRSDAMDPIGSLEDNSPAGKARRERCYSVQDDYEDVYVENPHWQDFHGIAIDPELMKAKPKKKKASAAAAAAVASPRGPPMLLESSNIPQMHIHSEEDRGELEAENRIVKEEREKHIHHFHHHQHLHVHEWNLPGHNRSVVMRKAPKDLQTSPEQAGGKEEQFSQLQEEPDHTPRTEDRQQIGGEEEEEESRDEVGLPAWLLGAKDEDEDWGVKVEDGSESARSAESEGHKEEEAQKIIHHPRRKVGGGSRTLEIVDREQMKLEIERRKLELLLKKNKERHQA